MHRPRTGPSRIVKTWASTISAPTVRRYVIRKKKQHNVHSIFLSCFEVDTEIVSVVREGSCERVAGEPVIVPVRERASGEEQARHKRSSLWFCERNVWSLGTWLQDHPCFCLVLKESYSCFLSMLLLSVFSSVIIFLYLQFLVSFCFLLNFLYNLIFYV